MYQTELAAGKKFGEPRTSNAQNVFQTGMDTDKKLGEPDTSILNIVYHSQLEIGKEWRETGTICVNNVHQTNFDAGREFGKPDISNVQYVYQPGFYTGKEQYLESNTNPITGYEGKAIQVVINNIEGQFTVTSRKDLKFYKFARHICEVAGWIQIKTRFIMDGDCLTLQKNGKDNSTNANVFKAMFGGKGPDEIKILRMLKDCNSETDGLFDSINLDEAAVLGRWQ